MKDLLEIYHRNFPNNIRNEKTVKMILENKQNHIIRKYDDNKLIGVSIINKSTILMLCVDNEYRNQGIGRILLKESEKYILEKGYKKVNIGVGFEYLMPGIPINEETILFMKDKGYIHSWGNVECFDLDMELNDFIHNQYSLGDTINDIVYDWAKLEDIKDIIACADDACQFQDEKFSKYYKNPMWYDNLSSERVIKATKNNIIIGCIVVCIETEGKNIGSVGCTCVRYDYMHHKIGTNMVMLGTKYLKDKGLKYGHIGYTYSGLDKMYGYSGYKISVKYMMAEKNLNNDI